MNILKKIYIFFLVAFTAMLSGCMGSSPSPQETYPKVSENAEQVLYLQSNKPNTDYFIDDKKIVTGKRVKVLVEEDRSYTVKAKPKGYIEKEFFIQPPYSNYPISFTFMIGDKLDKQKNTSQVQADITPPKITLYTPEPSRSLKLKVRQKKIDVLGKVEDESDITVFLINGNSVNIDQKGLFKTTITLAENDNNLNIKAVDSFNNIGRINIDIESASEQKKKKNNLKWYKKQHALIVGIDHYSNQDIPPLNNAVGDAKEIAKILKKMNYQVVELYNKNATKDNILEHLIELTNKTGGQDSFLFYFAGHGQAISLNSGDKVGYLLPQDVKLDLQEQTYIRLQREAISLPEIQNIAKDIKARHIALLLDSCFSGLVMTRSIPKKSMEASYYSKLLERNSINILTAGDDQPVSDGSGHSPFATALINALEKANIDLSDNDGYATFEELATYVKKKVEIQTNRKQRPQYGNLSQDDGSYLFKFNKTKK